MTSPDSKAIAGSRFCRFSRAEYKIGMTSEKELFLLIPLLLIIVSVTGIFFIIRSKRSYLDKLYALDSGNETESISLDFGWRNYGSEMFPEIKSLIDRLKLYEHRASLLVEIEKSLRRARLIFLKIDNWSDALIKKVRRIYLNDKLNGYSKHNAESQSNDLGDGLGSKPYSAPPSISVISPNFLRNEEGDLIMKIAQNPKDPKLYESLGDLYVEMENFADAKEAYEAAMELGPQNELIKQKLSSVLEKFRA